MIRVRANTFALVTGTQQSPCHTRFKEGLCNIATMQTHYAPRQPIRTDQFRSIRTIRGYRGTGFQGSIALALASETRQPCSHINFKDDPSSRQHACGHRNAAAALPYCIRFTDVWCHMATMQTLTLEAANPDRPVPLDPDYRGLSGDRVPRFQRACAGHGNTAAVQPYEFQG